jgi:hypothetical protein
LIGDENELVLRDVWQAVGSRRTILRRVWIAHSRGNRLNPGTGFRSRFRVREEKFHTGRLPRGAIRECKHIGVANLFPYISSLYSATNSASIAGRVFGFVFGVGLASSLTSLH